MNDLTVDQLATALQEPNVDLLRPVLTVLGPDHTTQLLAQTLEVEAQGGMLIMNGTRRRTPGGVFFQLVRQQATRSQRDYLFPRAEGQPSQGQGPAQPHAQPQALTWDEVHTIRGSRRYQQKFFGRGDSDGITVGRQARVHTKKQYVMLYVASHTERDAAVLDSKTGSITPG